MKPIIIGALLLLVLPARVGAAPPLEFVAYGEGVLRENNLAGTGYRSPWGLRPEARLLVGDRVFAERPRPYLKVDLSYTGRAIPVENTATYGVGVEIRPLIVQFSLARPRTAWLMNLRLYAEYLEQGFFRGGKPLWNPRHNWIVGLDLWKEFGAVDPDRPDNPDRHWAELFLGAAYHDTNFYLADYDSVRYGLNVRLGTLYPVGGYNAMPYIMLDVNGSGPRHESFENRVIGAVGLRTQWRLGPKSSLKLFAEQRYILGYLYYRPSPRDGVPSSDQVLGVSLQVNRY